MDHTNFHTWKFLEVEDSSKKSHKAGPFPGDFRKSIDGLATSAVKHLGCYGPIGRSFSYHSPGQGEGEDGDSNEKKTGGIFQREK